MEEQYFADRPDRIQIIKHMLDNGQMDSNMIKARITPTVFRRKDTELLKLIITHPLSNLDLSFNFDLLIRESSRYGLEEIVKLLLEYPSVNPSKLNGYAIRLASENGHLGVVKLLLMDSRVDPTAFNNGALLQATLHGRNDVVRLLLTDPRVDPTDENYGIVLAAIVKKNVELINMYINDPRVDPNVDNGRLLISAVGADETGELLKLFLNNTRVHFYNIDLSILSTQTADIIKLLHNRIDIDSYFGLVTVDDYYKHRPAELLKFINSNKTYLSSNRINYIFNCLDIDKFNTIINSDISDDELSTLLGHVKRIRFDISLSRRNLTIVLKDLIDKEYLTKYILSNKSLLPILTHNNIGNSNLLAVYRKYDFNLPLTRTYQLGDIIGRRDVYKLYNYILEGNYLPYEKHVDAKLWFDVEPDERSFLETFRFPSDIHDDFMKNLSQEEYNHWHEYVYGDYETFNNLLRDGKPLSPHLQTAYKSLRLNILQSEPVKHRCIVYRGISAPELYVEIGTVVRWNSFSSCSSVKEISDTFQNNMPCCMFIIIIPVGAKILNITYVKRSENEIVLPPQSILLYLGLVGENMIFKYLGYETDLGAHYFEDEVERNVKLEDEINRYAFGV